MARLSRVPMRTSRVRSVKRRLREADGGTASSISVSIMELLLSSLLSSSLLVLVAVVAEQIEGGVELERSDGSRSLLIISRMRPTSTSQCVGAEVLHER